MSSRTESQTHGNLYATTDPAHTTYETVNRLGSSPINGYGNQMENNVLMNTPLVNPGQSSPAQSNQLIPDSVGSIPYMDRSPRKRRRAKRLAKRLLSYSDSGSDSTPLPSIYSALVAKGGPTKDYYPAAEMVAQRDLEAAKGSEGFQYGESVLLIPQSAAEEFVTEQPRPATPSPHGRVTPTDPDIELGCAVERRNMEYLESQDEQASQDDSAVCPASSFHFCFY